MQKLAEICVRRPVFASVLILLLSVTGLFGYLRLGVDQYPDVEFPFVVVTTTLPGAAPEEVETEVTDRIEESINTVSGIDELRSISREGVSIVMAQFVLEKNGDVAAQEVRDRVARIRPQLPEDVDEPGVEKFDPGSIPVVTVAVSADKPLREISEFADKILRRRLESTNGVGQVVLIGQEKRQINVLVDPVRLRAEQLTVNDVENALRTENAQIPGGTLKQGPEEFTLRILGRVKTVDELNVIPIARRGERSVTLRDVATVEDGSQEKESHAQLNGRNAVLLSIRKQSKANTIEVADAVKDRLQDEVKIAPEGYQIDVVRDESVFIRASTHAVQEHLVVGSILAALVVLLFLANWRTTLIAAIAIPTSLISTFGLMSWMGYTLNMITLLALTLSVGIVVDDAIVVLENIYRYIDEKGYKPFDAAIAATREIGLAVMAITLSLIAVFLPIAFMGGIVGQYMASFGVTMSFAIAVSMLVSFTLTPMLSARMLRPAAKKLKDQTVADSEPIPAAAAPRRRWSFYRLIENVYMAMLRFSLRHRWIIVLACVAALGSMPTLVQKVNKNFLPADDQSQFNVNVRAQEGTSLAATNTVMERISKDVRALAGVKYTVTTVGEGGAGNVGSIYVRLEDMEKRAFDQFAMMDLIRTKVLPTYASENLRTSVTPDEGGWNIGGRNAEVMYIITGPKLEKLGEYADKVVADLKKVPGALDVDSSLVLGKPQYGAIIDRAKAAELGVSVSSVANALRLLVAGDRVSSYDEGGERYDVHLRAVPKERNSIETLRLVTVPSSRLGSVSLFDVVKFEKGIGPAEIQRFGRKRQVTVYADVEPGKSQQAIIDSVQSLGDKIGMEAGYSGGMVGRSKELQKSTRAFFLVFAMSLIFMYLIIAAQFESWLHPFTILLSLPLTLPFALIAVLIMNESLNIFSMLGILVLFAVVKKNSILQIDHANHLREQGMERHEAILQSNKDRLRPILMTTMAFVAGMLPLMLSQGVGAATNHTIAAVVIGGQSLSLLLTLLATPVAYSLFDDLIELRRKLWRRLMGTRSAPA